MGDAVNVAARLQAAAAGRRHPRRRAHAALSARGDRLPRAGAAGAEGQGRARQRMGGARGRASRRTRAGSRARSAPLVGREEELSRLESCSNACVRDGSAAPRDGRRPGGRRQVAPAAGARAIGSSSALRRSGSGAGAASPFGRAIVYWPLAEMLRAECGIGEGEDAELVRAKLHRATRAAADGAEGDADLLERRIAPLARLLGAGAPGGEVAAEREDQQNAREGFFGAVRAVLEALARDQLLVHRVGGHPLGRRGHARPDRLPLALAAGPGAAGLPRARRAARATARLERAAGARVTAVFLEPLAPEDARELIEALLRSAGTEVDCRPARWPSARAATRCSPRRWFSASPRRARAPRRSCPTPCRVCWPRDWTRSSRSSASSSRTRRCSGGRSGRARSSLSPSPAGEPFEAALAHRCARRTSSSPGDGAASRGRARARLQARADPGRGLRDAAEGRARAQARRGRRVHRASAPAGAARGRSRSSPSTTRAPPRSPPRRICRRRARRAARPGARVRRGGGRRRRRRCTPTAKRWPTTRRRSRWPTTSEEPRSGSPRSAAMSRCASAGSSRRSSCGSGCLELPQRATASSSTSPSCTARSAPRSRTRASARARSSTTSRGST